MLNKRGPRTKPCGTPGSNSDQELTVVPILVLYHLFIK